MSCCGQFGGRLVIDQNDINQGLRLEVEYRGGRPIQVVGGITGLKYDFSGLSRLVLIDPRDAPGLLRSRSFRLMGAKKIDAGQRGVS